MEGKNILLKIKSKVILKKLFLAVNDYIKLDLINYNKVIQNKINISIEDYKKRCTIYRIGEKNGKGKFLEIYTDKLIYEGEFLNGKKNGKGIEYNLKEI